MDFTALMGAADDMITQAFERKNPDGTRQLVTIHFADGRPDATAPCIVKNPMLEEDYMPGSQTGTSMLILFIPASAGVVALRGDICTYGGVDYNVEISDADRIGGVHIRMRRRSPYP